MIIREREHEFVMIDQNHHGHVSKEIMQHWKKELFPDSERKDSVLTAIKHHDIGWAPFDKEPFWNDASQKPYSFTDFPFPAKLTLYEKGLDEVEIIDPYAAMLCSVHYSQFLTGSKDEDAQIFLKSEYDRRQRLRKDIQAFDERLFNQHYGLLQLGDNFSLYVCINEPGVSKIKEHPFFVNGIPNPTVLKGREDSKLAIRFHDENTVLVDPFPFNAPFDIQYTQRVVSKQEIQNKGLVKAFAEGKIETIFLKLQRI